MPAVSNAIKRREWHLNRNVLWLSLPALIVVLALFIYPFIFGLGLSFTHDQGPTGFTMDNYLQFFRDARQVSTLWRTFLVAIPITFFSVAVSIPLAYYMRHGIRFERLVTAILILPLTLGTVLVAQAMDIYFGPIGWFNLVLQLFKIIQAPLQLTHNFIGVEIALFIQGFPFTFLMIVGYMSAINPDLERASRMLGASTWRTFWRIVFPLTLPGIATAFCLNFVSNFGVFPTAELIGEPTGATRVLAIAAYEAGFQDYNRPFGSAIALIMGALELLVIGLILWMRNRLTRGATISGGKGA